MKYELTSKTKVFQGKTLHRIRALKDFGVVKAGDLGGWIEGEANLSREGECWVCDSAKVFGSAVVCDYAKVYNNAIVCDSAIVRDYAKVCDSAIVRDYAIVCDSAIVRDYAKVFGSAIVRDYAKVRDYAVVRDYAKVCDSAIVRDYAVVNNCILLNQSMVCGNAKPFKSVIKYGAYIDFDFTMDDRMYYFKASGRPITACFKENKIVCVVGCQKNITLDEFKKRIFEDGNYESIDDLPPHRKEYLKIIEILETIEKNESEAK